MHDPRHPPRPVCWCRWAWAGAERWFPAARDGDTEDRPEDIREDPPPGRVTGPHGS